MLWDWLAATTDDRRRGDERAGPFTPGPIPPVLRRRTLYALTAAYAAGVVYGTLAPFQVDPAASWQWNLPWRGLVPGDATANVLLYVPLGVLARLVVRRRGSTGIRDAWLSFALLVALSFLCEACQSVLRHRVGTWTDVCCNAAGAFIGVGLAVFVQRVLRNQHAWFFVTLRRRPYRTAAAALAACVTVLALMPFDFRPTPQRVRAAVVHLSGAPLALPWTTPGEPTRVLSPRQLYDKMLGAGAFGLIAFALVLGARESGRPRERAVRYALTRTLVLAGGIEALQMLTVSHVADARDLLVAWACAGLGAATASCRLARRNDRLDPPTSLLSGLAVLLAAALTGRLICSAMTFAGQTWPGMHPGWPLAAFFGYSWDRLMVFYGGRLILYGAVSLLIALWLRARRRRPSVAVIVGTALALSCLAMAVAWRTGHPVDTAQPLLALAGAVLAVRFDRALLTNRLPQTPAGLEPLARMS